MTLGPSGDNSAYRSSELAAPSAAPSPRHASAPLVSYRTYHALHGEASHPGSFRREPPADPQCRHHYHSADAFTFTDPNCTPAMASCCPDGSAPAAPESENEKLGEMLRIEDTEGDMDCYYVRPAVPSKFAILFFYDIYSISGASMQAARPPRTHRWQLTTGASL
eukprot:6195647-Pleurochrysis_carterae.AAC.5